MPNKLHDMGFFSKYRVAYDKRAYWYVNLMQFLDAVKRSLSNNMLKDQVEIQEQEETTAGEMLNFFMNIKKES